MKFDIFIACFECTKVNDVFEMCELSLFICQQASQTGAEARASRLAGIRLTVLAPELDNTNSELGVIASWPLSVHLLTVMSYSLLPSLISPAIAATCNGMTPFICGLGLLKTGLTMTVMKMFLFSDVNTCQSSPCVNGATCVVAYKSFTCLCNSTFGGRYCEKSKFTKLNTNIM